MAKQEVNIGVEGNDGTGDSIRESFRKVNENFTEIYAVFGLGGNISFTSLDDTPDELLGNEEKVVMVNSAGTGIEFFELVSDAGTNNPSDPANTISFTIDAGKLVVRAINARVSTDPSPEVTNAFKLGAATAYSSTIQNLMLDDGNRGALVTDWNATHGTPAITEDNLLISKGYGDLKYVNVSGDTMSGALVVPAGATGSQVPRVSEVVKKAGDTMTGALYLSDHPYPFEGAGTPSSEYDLQAATKYYVDSSSFISTVQLYVSTSGNDTQTNTPPGKEGRALSYSFRTVNKAAQKAERLQQASAPELGPYVQTVTYQSSGNTVDSTVNSIAAYSTNATQDLITSTIESVVSSVIDDVIDAIDAEYPTFVYNETQYRDDLAYIIDAVKLDIQASTTGIKQNYLSRYSGLRYYANPSSEALIAPTGQYTQTSFAITEAKTLMLAALTTAGVTGAWYTAVSNLFDVVLTTINSATPDPTLVESTNYYTFTINSGPNKYTDQSIVSNPDIFPGKGIRGKTTGAVGRILSYSRGIDTVGSPNYDTIEVQLLTPVEFSASEIVEYSSITNTQQITINVETGIYEEQLPIRVPVNTTVIGDDFRRSIIRPAAGRSTSTWADIYFYRDATTDGLATALTGDGHYSPDSTLQGYFGHHYLTDPNNPNSTAKYNNEIDIFLLNDGTSIKSLTFQNHGGFATVLDPEGQILSKSPFVQSCTSFARSINEKHFAGGMLIDGYAGNMPMRIVDKTNNFEIQVEAPSGSGLGIRKPALPTSFYVGGRRYQVNAIKDYIPNTAGVASATLVLDETSNEGQGLDDSVDSALGVIDINLLMGGNKSILANDYTQVNDQGYGIVATNNATSEIVSVFTYYCHIGYYAINGSSIRSLSGNNSYGNFGLVAEGSDPDEEASLVTLETALTQPVKVFNVAQIVKLSGTSLGIADSSTITQTQGAVTVSGNVVFTNETGGNTDVYVNNLVNGSFNNSDDVEQSPTNFGAAVSVTTLDYTADEADNALFVYDLTNYPMNGAEVEIKHTSGLYYPYAVVTATDTGAVIPAGKVASLCDSTNTAIRAKIWRLDLSSGVSTGASGVQEDIPFGTFGNYRDKTAFLINGIPANLATRPSTAMVFTEQESQTYRTIAFESSIVGSVPTPANVTKITTDANFDDVNLLVDNDRAGDPSVDSAGTMGATAGDTVIAIALLEGNDPNRVNTGNMLFTWNGVVHRITEYTVENDGSDFGVIRFADVYSINDSHTNGISARVDNTTGGTNALKATLDAGESATVTVNISTCRATGHDFLYIGTGGYNASNYPSRIYGAPVNTWVSSENSIDENGTALTAQVQERIKGRVFFTSTDQDGFFRVGRFFTVDQGTGSVTFNAALVLTNIDGIGFKRGVRVNEFSADDSFTNAQGDAVPTETAVEGYINRRLGWDRNGSAILAGDIIGGGAVKKTGDTMTGNLNMGGNNVVDLATPTNNSDAATKGYVDGQVAAFNELSELTDMNIATPAAGQTLVYDAVAGKWENATVSGDIGFSYNGTALTTSISTGVIVNADVSASAAISQSKLAMTAATTRANATSITQADLGLASFDSATFTATSGWINVSNSGITNAMLAGSIANNKLTNSSITVTDGSTPSNISLGGTLTFSGTASEVEVTQSGGTVTIGLPATINANTSGSAASATNSSTVTIAARNTDAGTHYPTFVTATSGSLAHFTDTGLTWVPSTNTLGFTAGLMTGLNKLTFAGATTVNEIVLPTNLADALSITDNAVSPNDLVVITTTTGAQSFNVKTGMTITGSILPGANSPTDSGQMLGGTGNRWNTVYATVFNGVATEALYADLAENYLGDSRYEPGTVLVFGGEHEVTVTSTKGDRRVAGVVTTNPAHLMNSALEGEFVTGIALQGRVPVKVLGHVQKGDLIVTSAIPGYGIVDNDPRVGTVIGKAVGNKTDDSKGIVEVVVGRV